MQSGLLISTWPHMTSPEGEQSISNGLRAAGITNALKNGETCLEPLDSFADIDPLVSKHSIEQDGGNIFQIEEGLIQHLSPKMKRILATWSGRLKMKMFLML